MMFGEKERIKIALFQNLCCLRVLFEFYIHLYRYIYIYIYISIYIYIYVRISVCLCVCVSVCLSERGCREARLELDAEILHRSR